MGPIGVARTCSPSCPRTRWYRYPGLSGGNDVVSATPYGSASILPISWTYIALMGGRGSRRPAGRHPVANYIAHRLRDHYPVLYTGATARWRTSASSTSADQEASGIGEEDIAKRLMDFGFHAPTMSFPVAGTLMIEPTESESLAELDRFCDAMITIREEIRAVERGRVAPGGQPAGERAAHQRDLVAEHWEHPTAASSAAFAAAAPCAWTSTGRRLWRASTTSTATGTCSAPVRQIDDYREASAG
jgi:glycine dehydrogenase